MTSLTKILYVEDDDDIRSITTLTLETIGNYKICACESGEAAIAQFVGAQPDLVLLDVMMPGMDGPRTLAALRELPRGANIPVIFMTAKVQKHETEGYLALGAIGVIHKPFDPMTLADQIRSLWQERAA